MGTVVVFKLDDRRMAVRAENISRVVWAVEITAVPGQSKRVLGFINVEGLVLPVIDFRGILNMPARAVGLDNHILVSEVHGSSVACVVDAVEDVLYYDDAQYVAFDVNAGDASSGIIKTPDGEMIAVVDLVNFLGVEDLKLMNVASPAARKAG